ncbi:MAG: ABC transporter permease [Deltaproteobacteria bacterium]|nr:ABC transporter permease [Deltaproteobacteria bacterium]
MLALIREISLRHLIGSPVRSLMVVLGIALGVAVLIATQATSESMLKSFDELVDRVAGRADLMLIGNESGIDSSLVAKVAKIDGVEHAAAALEITTRFADDGQTLLVLGVDFLGDVHFLPFEPEPGHKNIVRDPLVFANDPTAILITEKLAARKGLKQNSPIKLLTSEGVKRFTIAGILEDSGPAASFGGQVAVMFLDAAQISFAKGTLVDRVDIALSKNANLETMKKRIAKVVGEAARIELPEQMGERISDLSKQLGKGLSLSGLIALLVGMFIIYNAIGVAVSQRRKETGVLRALGVTRTTVVLHFCFEAMLLAIPGILLGLLLARQLMRFTHKLTAEPINRVYVATLAEPTITQLHVIEGIGAGLLISVLAAFIPATRGARMDPIHALRPSAIIIPDSALPYRALGIAGALLIFLVWVPLYLKWEYGGIYATLLNVCGSALIAPAVVVVLRIVLVSLVERLFGIPGRLGLDNVVRNLGRSSINVLALMVAVSMSVTLSGWLNSFEQSIREWFDQIAATDLTITAGSPFIDRRHLPISRSTVDRIKDIDGIAAIQAARLIEQRVGEKAITLVASNTKQYLSQAKRRNRSWKILDGKAPIEPDELERRPLIVLSENAAFSLKLKAGDSISLPTNTGQHRFKVRAVVVDYSSELGTAFIDLRYYVEMWKDHALDAINLYLEDGADSARVTEQIRQRLGGGGFLFVTTTADLGKQFLALLDRSFAYSRALELVVLFIALMGVVGTMVSAVLDRTREIGMVRAIGSTRGQVVVALVTEAAFLGFCAVVGGVIAGTLQCFMLLRVLTESLAGWHIDFVFPAASTLRVALLVVLTSAAAGFLPGLRAARMDIKQALAYE